MKNRILFFFITLGMMFFIVGCASKTDTFTNEAPKTTETKDESEESSLEDAVAVFDVEVDSDLLDVEMTIPKEFSSERTQEELDQFCKEQGYKSARINSDGSITYVMSKKRHKELMEELRTEYVNTFNEMVDSEDYPNITDIKISEDFRKITVTTKSKELSLSEGFSNWSFFIAGAIYNVYNGTPADNIQVEWINADSGETITICNSSESSEEK